MKRTLTIIGLGILTLAVSVPTFGQCPGGNCSRAAYWSPWGYYYSTPCKGGKCNTGRTTKPQTENKSLDSLPEPPADPEPEVVELKPFCQQVIELVNQARAQAGLPAFAADTIISNGCESHSRYMRSYGFGHAYGAGLECIAYGVATPQAVVRLWLNSSGHRAILLGRGSKIGVGFSGTFWTLRVR